jgi:hypothetical protein
MQVFARSFESLATDSTALRFPAPLADRAPDPAGFEFWWKMLEFVFQLPDPSSFPKLSVLPLGPELAVLRRYIAAAEDMAGSAPLSGGDAFTVHVSDDGAGIEHVDATEAIVSLSKWDTSATRSVPRPLLDAHPHDPRRLHAAAGLRPWKEVADAASSVPSRS